MELFGMVWHFSFCDEQKTITFEIAEVLGVEKSIITQL